MSTAQVSEQLEPFFFGPPTQQLFGCYHEPPVWPAREQGVLLCYPAGQEYIRSHRAMFQLAARLSRAGFPTLRFDWFGTGDSHGDDVDGNLDQWLSDLHLAAAELKARGGVEQVIVAGLRLGASLALLGGPAITGLAGLVLWEPVINGHDYLAELQRLHDETILRFYASPNESPPDTPLELLGFAVSERLRDAIEQLDLLAAPPIGRPALVVESHDNPAITALQARLVQTASSTHMHVPSFTVWVEDVDKGLVPQQVIDAIAGWLDRSFG